MAKKKYYQRPDGLYEVSRTINGKRVRFRGKTCREVDRKIVEYSEAEERGRKFPEVADEWFEYHGSEIGQSTYNTYLNGLRRLKSSFRGYIKDIKPTALKAYVEEFEKKGYSKSTVSVNISVMKQIFSYAVMKGDIEISPAAEIRHSKNLPQKKRSALTEEQERAVENYRGDDWLLGYMLLYTGARRGELLALNWEDIDREKGVIHFNKKLNYAYGTRPRLENKMKSRNGFRDTPILAPLLAVLPDDKKGKIFKNAKGDYLSEYEMKKRWQAYCRNVGLVEFEKDENGNTVEVFNITPHCLRHSFTTICYEAGLDIKSTAKFIGDTEKVTQEIYTELRERKSAEGIEKVNEYLERRAAERL